MPGTHYRVARDLDATDIAMYSVDRGNISSRFSSNSEANASELLENLEDIFPR